MSTHACPGRCGSQVPYRLYACRPCWRRLPWGLQMRITAAWRGGNPVPAEHRAAMHDAKIWFRDHPLTSTVGSGGST